MRIIGCDLHARQQTLAMFEPPPRHPSNTDNSWTAPLNETAVMGALCWQRAAKWSGSDTLGSFNAWQLSACGYDNIGDLAKELGVGRRCLYKWQAVDVGWMRCSPKIRTAAPRLRYSVQRSEWAYPPRHRQ
jgi:hypothetical protein